MPEMPRRIDKHIERRFDLPKIFGHVAGLIVTAINRKDRAVALVRIIPIATFELQSERIVARQDKDNRRLFVRANLIDKLIQDNKGRRA